MSGAAAAFFLLIALPLLFLLAVNARRISAKVDRVQRANWPFDEDGL